MTEQQLREEMVQIGASLFSRGYATGSAGNLRISIYRYLTFPTRYCINGKHPLDYHG
ncbi:putative class II aldolase (fragment) [Klebsiella pneumoniae]